MAEAEQEFIAVNKALRAAGLPGYEEPKTPQGEAPWSIRIGSYSCIHYLRRLVAHLWAGNGLVDPCVDDKAAKDPILQDYHRFLNMTSETRKLAQARAPLHFDHLVHHSDCAGYYVPLPFREVIVAAPTLYLVDGFGGEYIGSSFTLMDECEQIADVLDLPLDIHPEAVREVSLRKGGGEATWERYGVESFVCSALYHACHVSISSGCALVFC